MPTPSIVFVLSPHQNAYFHELAEVLVFEVEAVGARASIVVDTHEHRPAVDEVFVLLPPHEYVALEGEGWLADPRLLRRTIGISAEQPHQTFFSRNGELAARFGGHFDLSRHAVDEYRRGGLPTQHLAFGYTPYWDSPAPAVADRTGPDVLYLGNSRPRRLAALAEAAAELGSLRTTLLIADHEFPKTGPRPNFVTGDAKRALLRSTRLLVNIHQSDEPYFEWLRFVEAAHCMAPVLSEVSVHCEPFLPGSDFAEFRLHELSSTLRRLAGDDERLEELAQTASATLRANPTSASIGELVETAATLLDGPPPPALPSRTRMQQIAPLTEQTAIVTAPAPPGGRRHRDEVVSFDEWLAGHGGDARVLIAPSGLRPLPAMSRLRSDPSPLVTGVVAGRRADGTPTLEGWTPWEPWRLMRGQHLGRLVLVDGWLLAAARPMLADPVLGASPALCAQATAARLGVVGSHIAAPVAFVDEPLDPAQSVDAATAARLREVLTAVPDTVQGRRRFLRRRHPAK